MNPRKQTTLRQELKINFVIDNGIDLLDRRSKAQKAQELKDDMELLEILELDVWA